MKPQFYALGLLAAMSAVTGCGGSGATIGGQPISPGNSPTPKSSLAPGETPSPTPSPTVPGATPTPTLAPGVTPTPTLAPGVTPTPTPTATAAVSGAIYHPGDNGDAFTMAGTLLITYQRPNQYPTPEPTSTTFDNVVQAVSVTNPASFNGTAAVEFAIAETDSQTAPATQTFTDTMDDYFQYSNNMVSGNFLDLGYVETDDSGFTATVTNGSNDQLADILPETSGKTWSNMAGRTIATNDGKGETSTTTYADDGSYTGTIVYPEDPSASGMQTDTANLTANVDGSADYKTPRFGETLQYNYDYNIQAPSAAGSSGTISETTTIPPAVGSTATPEAVATSVANWLPPSVPGALANETDVDNGPVALPSTCAVPSALVGTPNQIVQSKLRVDPLNGELETTTTTTYDSASIGPICVVLDDVQDNYYDFSGQNGTGYFSGAPQQITTIREVLYLTAETVQTIARHPETHSRYATERAVNVATGQARIAMAHTRMRLQMLGANRAGRSFEKSFRSFKGLLK